MTRLVSGTMLGLLRLEHVIEYYDFPRIFSCRSSTGQLYISLSTYDDENECRWLYLPVTHSRCAAIFRGEFNLRMAFRAPEGGFLVEAKTYSNARDEAFYILPDQVDDTDLPAEHYDVPNHLDVSSELQRAPPQEVALATRRETFDYRIYPGVPRAHEIPARKLGNILSVTQELIDALGQAATGVPTVRGPIPAELLQKTKVNVTEVFHGSFGVQFLAANYNDLLGESTVASAIFEMTNLLRAADSEELLSNKLHVLHGRVASKYRRLLKELSDIESGLALDWGSVNQEAGGQFFLSADEVKRAYAVVDKIDIAMAEEVTITGKLIGFNTRTRSYEIESGSDNKSYRGKVAEEAIIEVTNPAVGEYYMARLRMLVETQSTSGDELVRWILVGLRASQSSALA